MTFEEKNIWVSTLVTLGAFGVYWVRILARAQSIPIAEVPYIGLMFWMIGIAIATSILGNMAVAMTSPKGADKTDQRDREINRYGDSIGFYILSVGMGCVLVLTMFKIEHFWIANAIYAVFVVTTLSSAVIKIVVYRRGF